jgi:transposase-like protein
MEKSEATSVTPVRDRRALPAVDRTVKRRRRHSLEEKQAILKAAAVPGGDGVGSVAPVRDRAEPDP